MAKVVVDHNGSCGGYHYQAGEVVDLPDDVIKALGTSAKPVYGAKEAPKQEVKEAEAPRDKMVRKAKVTK